jgi:hypothetical protein
MPFCSIHCSYYWLQFQWYSFVPLHLIFTGDLRELIVSELSILTVAALFNVAVRHLMYIKYVWYYYFYVLLFFAFGGLIYLFIFPSDRKQAEKGLVSKDAALP